MQTGELYIEIDCSPLSIGRHEDALTHVVTNVSMQLISLSAELPCMRSQVNANKLKLCTHIGCGPDSRKCTITDTYARWVRFTYLLIFFQTFSTVAPSSNIYQDKYKKYKWRGGGNGLRSTAAQSTVTFPFKFPIKLTETYFFRHVIILCICLK